MYSYSAAGELIIQQNNLIEGFNIIENMDNLQATGQTATVNSTPIVNTSTTGQNIDNGVIGPNVTGQTATIISTPTVNTSTTGQNIDNGIIGPNVTGQKSTIMSAPTINESTTGQDIDNGIIGPNVTGQTATTGQDIDNGIIGPNVTGQTATTGQDIDNGIIGPNVTGQKSTIMSAPPINTSTTGQDIDNGIIRPNFVVGEEDLMLRSNDIDHNLIKMRLSECGFSDDFFMKNFNNIPKNSKDIKPNDFDKIISFINNIIENPVSQQKVIREWKLDPNNYMDQLICYMEIIRIIAVNKPEKIAIINNIINKIRNKKNVNNVHLRYCINDKCLTEPEIMKLYNHIKK